MSVDTPQTILVKPVSADCNLACAYCFYAPKSSIYPETNPRMSEETLTRMIEETLMTGAPSVSFVWQGGEPTLAGLEFFEKAVELQELYRYPGQTVNNSIQTNGVLLDENWAKFFKKKGWLVGLSLDGPELSHDVYRVFHNHQGSYASVNRGLDKLREKGVQYNILTLLNDVNVKKPSELYRWLVGSGHKHLQFIPCMELNSYGKVAEFSITPEEYGKFLIEVFDEWVKDIPEVYVRDFEDILIGLVTGNTPNCVFNGRCGEYIVVEYNGDAYPCDFFVDTEWHLGNINETGIEKLYQSEKMNEFRKNRRLQEKCKSCNWTEYCYGGCQKTVLYGEYYFCESIKLFLKERGSALKSLAEQFSVQY